MHCLWKTYIFYSINSVRSILWNEFSSNSMCSYSCVFVPSFLCLLNELHTTTGGFSINLSSVQETVLHIYSQHVTIINFNRSSSPFTPRNLSLGFCAAANILFIFPYDTHSAGLIASGRCQQKSHTWLSFLN